MAVIKIPDGKGGWVRLPTVKGDQGETLKWEDLTQEQKNEITGDYNIIKHKPSIESIELIGNKTFEDLGLTLMTEEDINNLL